MAKKESDLVPKMRVALLAAGADAAPPEFADALASAVLTAIVVRANSGEEHQVIANVIRAMRANLTDAIERKSELVAEAKRRRK